ncbi:MAG TPA: MotA/TolQ/ExbB proton channel family protein [Candidatus Hydrogenedentes bacterium]|nr:MotA/TolQ/ExbB proton channel family protein [Candidatus Hydrogenedentota bacterium]HOV75778.1 MotA/TolQ/ExbB proton channel family protein [Candidatus Hydrogenedentota bacterium]HPC17353.1 MotA/TolQ/ExbB proton channel family protein [Candidatus Hydrogenedentota bacterium]HRT20087.1 MotA/TolQ/ExbB proton channel family protein [Candidatus Hydrogenedentota bacterium]HRT64849.1 MotA/TolQ/ExbB proton channel family protein [Candidatus Hydrogenedentota bacterium]
MDPTSIIGIILGIVLVVGAGIEEGLPPSSLIAPSALVIILGGTIGATMTCYSMNEIKSLISATSSAFKKRTVEFPDLFEMFGELATLARREGLLVLENHPIPIDSPLLKRGVGLIVDGTEPALLRDMLTTELYTFEERAKTMAGIWSTAGGFAPTMGIIGTVMGLILVMGNLENASELGPSIAVAFMATFYGVSSANLVMLPIGKKMLLVAKEETQIGLVIVEGLVSIQSGDNPRVVQEKLKSYIDESMWARLHVKAPVKETK